MADKLSGTRPDTSAEPPPRVLPFKRPHLIVMREEQADRYCAQSVKAEEIRWSL